MKPSAQAELIEALERDEPDFVAELKRRPIPPDFNPNDPAKLQECLNVAKRDQCRFCDKEGAAPMRCSTCKVARYCDKECQTLDWEKHKVVCKWDRLITQSMKEMAYAGHLDEQ